MFFGCVLHRKEAFGGPRKCSVLPEPDWPTAKNNKQPILNLFFFGGRCVEFFTFIFVFPILAFNFLLLHLFICIDSYNDINIVGTFRLLFFYIHVSSLLY